MSFHCIPLWVIQKSVLLVAAQPTSGVSSFMDSILPACWACMARHTECQEERKDETQSPCLHGTSSVKKSTKTWMSTPTPKLKLVQSSWTPRGKGMGDRTLRIITTERRAVSLTLSTERG